MTKFRAYASGGFTAWSDQSPRDAAAQFFTTYPTKRKCNVSEGETRDGLFISTARHRFFADVTPAKVGTLPAEG